MRHIKGSVCWETRRYHSDDLATLYNSLNRYIVAIVQRVILYSRVAYMAEWLIWLRKE